MLPDCKRCRWRPRIRPKRWHGRSVIGVASILAGAALLLICTPEWFVAFAISGALICIGAWLLLA